MITKNMTLRTIDNVRIMQDIIKPFEIDIDLKLGSYVVDARSFMGVMGLDLSREVTMILHTDNKEIANNVFNALDKGGI